MNYVAKLLSFFRTTSNDAKVTDVNVDIGGGDNKTAQHFSAPGDDSFPLDTDYVLVADIPRNGGKAAHGYLDPINEPVAQKGDKRIYGRESTNGAPVNQVWLKNDGDTLIENDKGSVLIKKTGGTFITTENGEFNINNFGGITGSNANGSFKLEAGGDFVVNGVTIDTLGNITTPAILFADKGSFTTALTAAAKQLVGHTHPAGTPPGNTGTNN